MQINMPWGRRCPKTTPEWFFPISPARVVFPHLPLNPEAALDHASRDHSNRCSHHTITNILGSYGHSGLTTPRRGAGNRMPSRRVGLVAGEADSVGGTFLQRVFIEQHTHQPDPPQIHSDRPRTPVLAATDLPQRRFGETDARSVVLQPFDERLAWFGCARPRRTLRGRRLLGFYPEKTVERTICRHNLDAG